MLRRSSQLETHKTLYSNILTGLGNGCLNEVLHRYTGLFDERLLEEADFLEVFFQTAFDDSGPSGRWAPASLRLLLINLPLLGHNLCRDLVSSDIERVRGCHLHSEIVYQGLEVVSASDKICFAVDLNQHSQAPATVNIRTDRAFLRTPCRALGSCLQTLFAQEIYGLIHNTIGGSEGFFTIHNSSPGLLTKFLDHHWGNLHGAFPSTCATRRDDSLWTLARPQVLLQTSLQCRSQTHHSDSHQRQLGYAAL